MEVGGSAWKYGEVGRVGIEPTTQLIKRSFLTRALLPSKTSTYTSTVVPRFVHLRIDKALESITWRILQWHSCVSV